MSPRQTTAAQLVSWVQFEHVRIPIRAIYVSFCIKNIYQATRQRQAMIFPGSGLFNKAGQWIVAAEMVETSRLFARRVAMISSDWLEAMGGSQCKYTYCI